MKDLSLNKITIFLIIPAALNLILIAAYFSGIGWLQEIISPSINREYGLVENLQIIFLLGIVVIAAFGLKIKKTRLERWIMAVILLGALFIFLEEIDYGLHFYKLISSQPLGEVESPEYINIHNIGNNTSRFKNVGDIGMIFLFIIFPLIFSRSRHSLIRYLTPDRLFIATMVLMLVISKFAHILGDCGVGNHGTLHGAISEFREVIIYYIFAVYFFELVFRRNYSSQSIRRQLPEN
jgi:hypothetical protein